MTFTLLDTVQYETDAQGRIVTKVGNTTGMQAEYTFSLLRQMENSGFLVEFYDLYPPKSLGIDRYLWGHYHDCSERLAAKVLLSLELSELSKLQQLHQKHDPMRWKSIMRYNVVPHALRTALDEKVSEQLPGILADQLAHVTSLVVHSGNFDLYLGGKAAQTLGTRTLNAINRKGVVNLVELTLIPEEDFAKWRQIGPRTVARVKQLLWEDGRQLTFAKF